MKACCAILLLVLLAAQHTAQATAVTTLRDVTYANPGGTPVKLDAYLVESENYILEGGNHGLRNAKPDWPDFRGATIKFLKKHLLN
jgi:hypothetical protein